MLKQTHYRNSPGGVITNTCHKKIKFSIDLEMLYVVAYAELMLGKYSETYDLDLDQLKKLTARQIEKRVLSTLENYGTAYFDGFDYPPAELKPPVQEHINSIFPQLLVKNK